jgi:hypothetical protein
MGKIVLFLTAGVLLLCGCSSMNIDSGKLSESEKLTIVDMARYTITKMRKNKKFVTMEEAAVINKKMPDIKIKYDAPREGKMMISWPLKTKTVNFVYSGKFLTDSAMWRMGIAKHDYRVSKTRTNPYSKVKDVNESDFNDLRKKAKKSNKKR